MPGLTPLAFAALAIYVEGPRHPYEVFQEILRRREDRLVKIRPGTLYHCVKRLAEDGLLDELGTDRDGNRPERTTYRITPAGEAAILAQIEVMLGRRAQEYPEFPLVAAEMHNLQPERCLELLEQRAAALRAEIISITADAKDALCLPEILWIEHGWLLTMLDADLTWTHTTIARIRSGDLTWDRDALAKDKELT